MSDVLLVFGEGGHAEQMRRLLSLLDIDVARCVAIVDRGGISDGLVADEWAVSSIRDKFGRNEVGSLTSCVRLFVTVWKIHRRHDIRTVISTGPGISIVPSLIYKLLGRKVVHVETWSRFESRSLTGRVMYRIAHKFYVQNSCLLRLYRKAIYSGRL